MGYCLSPGCQNPRSLDRAKVCHACGGKVVTFSSSSVYKTRQIPILYDPIYPDQARVRTVVNPQGVVYGHLMFSAFLVLMATLMLSETRPQKK
jgi:hypothetical protein